MATLKTVNGKLTGPDGNGIACSVKASLTAAANVAGTQELGLAAKAVPSAGDGTFVLTLYSNADLTPGTTKYTVVATGSVDGAPISQSWTILVPASAGPFEISNILA